MRMLPIVLVILIPSALGGCAGVKTITFDGQRVVKNEYVSFIPPKGWYSYEENPWQISQSGKTSQVADLHNDSMKGATYEIDVETNSYIDGTYTRNLFNEHAEYYTVFKDEDMELDDNDKEQGIGYVRDWINYVQGMKCSQGVFSRSHGGMMKDIRNKNYSISCGYYGKHEGKRILSISYSYNYAGDSIRHQKDADIPQDNLITVGQVELILKRAVNQLISTIKIKNFDRERMERKGLMHHGKQYGISQY